MVISPAPVNVTPISSIAAAAVMNINNQATAILSSSPIPPAQQQLLQQHPNAHQSPQNNISINTTKFSDNYEVKEELGK